MSEKREEARGFAQHTFNWDRALPMFVRAEVVGPSRYRKGSNVFPPFFFFFFFFFLVPTVALLKWVLAIRFLVPDSPHLFSPSFPAFVFPRFCLQAWPSCIPRCPTPPGWFCSQPPGSLSSTRSAASPFPPLFPTISLRISTRDGCRPTTLLMAC